MELFVQAMLFFFIPLTIITLFLSLWRARRRRQLRN
jgi:hypothetical protein